MSSLDMAIRDQLRYCRLTGNLYWKVTKSRVKVGDVAGSISSRGYMRTKVEGVLRANHRIAFFLEEGYWPVTVDHEDRDTLNNRWYNLRAATSQQNACNRIKHSNNSSGKKGVTFHKASGKYRAQLNGKHLGTFTTVAAASVAYEKAAQVANGNFYNKE